jgi:hypothetical protein
MLTLFSDPRERLSVESYDEIDGGQVWFRFRESPDAMLQTIPVTKKQMEAMLPILEAWIESHREGKS